MTTLRTAEAKVTATRPGPRVIDVFMRQLEHPLKREIELARKTILGADKAISDDVKWNSLSFRTQEFFATVHLRSHAEVQLVFHLGAKVRKTAVKLEAPEERVKWLGTNRCIFRFGAADDARRNVPALKRFVRDWIRFV